jgi:hypothetical protein
LALPLDRWIATARSSLLVARRAADACLRDYALRGIFARDIAAAHADGLLVLGDLHAPLELAACVLETTAQSSGLVEAIEEARTLAGSVLAIDGPEYSLARGTADPAAIANYVRELAIGLRATGLQAVVNLNCAVPPSWAADLADGPLFAGQRLSSETEPLTGVQDGLLDPLLAAGGALRVDWHLSEREFAPDAEARLLRLARRALDARSIAFVFDRPRRLVGLAEGIDRRHPAVLLRVGLDLVRLSDQPALRGDPTVFLQKLGSLARLALSAASQKREFLRRNSEGRLALTRGFLLERARLVAVPIGLDAVVRSLTGRSLCAGGTSLELARQIIVRLRDTLRQDGQQRHLDCCLDSCAGFCLDETVEGIALPLLPRVAGLAAWEVGAPAKQQLRVAGTLHAAAEMGSAAVLFTDETDVTAEDVVQWLRQAWQQTDVARVSFVRLPLSQQQLTMHDEPRP